MKILLYTKTVCSQCIPIKGYLKAHNIPFDTINIEHDEKAYDFLKSQNYQATPVVFLKDGDKVVDTTFGRKAAIDVPNWYKEGLIHA